MSYYASYKKHTNRFCKCLNKSEETECNIPEENCFAYYLYYYDSENIKKYGDKMTTEQIESLNIYMEQNVLETLIISMYCRESFKEGFREYANNLLKRKNDIAKTIEYIAQRCPKLITDECYRYATRYQTYEEIDIIAILNKYKKIN